MKMVVIIWILDCVGYMKKIKIDQYILMLTNYLYLYRRKVCISYENYCIDQLILIYSDQIQILKFW